MKFVSSSVVKADRFVLSVDVCKVMNDKSPELQYNIDNVNIGKMEDVRTYFDLVIHKCLDIVHIVLNGTLNFKKLTNYSIK